IRDAQLWDIPLGGHLFTRLNKHGNKLSKLDRFLASESFAPLLQKISGHVLECHIFDHRPILLTPISVDFGPTPFKFYNSWLSDKTLHTSINDLWINFILGNSTNPIVAFKNKMKALKIVINEWSLNRKDARTRLKEDLISKIKALDADFANGSSSTDGHDQRATCIDNLRQIEHDESIDSSQKAKNNGHWIEDPTGIKDVFTNFFEQKFQQIQVVNIINRSPFYKSLNSDQTTLLVAPVLDSEIKNAIWDCGSEKSPGMFPKGCNTSFITLIPKTQNPMVILNGPLMVNEVIQWCKRKKSKLMVFKIDFEKAFDTVSWDFLFRVMHFLGFSDKWINWIYGCLHSSTSSILINGSPTREFNIHRGLRQGDSLSPFLFIIAMEGLHVAMEDVMDAGLYNGFKINNTSLSHLFFADDALFIGEWSRSNIQSLVGILDCFHKVSGLKINYHKSKLFGYGVTFDEVSHLASITGCDALLSPFDYLGIPINSNMALVK
nr:putative RNA-directed DNA polymerase, eukaryota, reverse transcriptase zinc-binding domain protein [Tanacetum cinerariifolium]